MLAGCGGGGASGTTAPTPSPGGSGDPGTTRTRYSFNNQCFALKAGTKFVGVSGEGYALHDAVGEAEPFYLKPSSLGSYLMYAKSSKMLLTAAAAASNPNGAVCTPGQPLCKVASDAATDSSVFVVKTAGDATAYPPAPVFDVEPTPAAINAYRAFVQQVPLTGTEFTFASAPDGRLLTVDGEGALGLATATSSLAGQKFTMQSLTPASCVAFPEAHNNVDIDGDGQEDGDDNALTGNTFKGTYQGRVLGMADVHVHTVSTTFLGGAKTGAPFHKFGVEQALANCSSQHGAHGERDALAAAYQNDTDGHASDGWPTLTDWPAAPSLTHESIYWKWLERGWLAGLRIMVNDVVENGTLCELQRNASNDTSRSCNEMESAGRQVGTLYAMQDYIDAQKGGPGKGWFRIVLSPAEARSEIAKGNLAVVIGIEVSNLFNCQVTYQPTRMQNAMDETGEGGTEASYKCNIGESGTDHVGEISTQLNDMWDLGARQIISIHEFDNAFGGNGIFDGLFLNLGTRENSGGNPTPGVPPDDPFANNGGNETPTGEFWTTYTCKTEADGEQYLWDHSPGHEMTNFGGPGCPPTALGGKYWGGASGCYPAERQCNARWMTPIGLYLYRKMMEKGILIDIDHLTLDMKSQMLDLAEAQSPAYPFVSTHGMFGGTTIAQARRMLKNGGFMYPSLDSGPGLMRDMADLKAQWTAAGVPYLFGFGFGTDTNGLSGQAGHEQDISYPYTLFKGAPFDSMPEFAGASGVKFFQPREYDARTTDAPRTWSLNTDGSAHYGMLSDMVEEVRRAGTDSDMRDLFNSAEVYLQTWERTLAARDAILLKGDHHAVVPPGVLRAADPVAYTPPLP